MTQSTIDGPGRPKRAAMFIDFDNLYSILDSQSRKGTPTSDYAEEIIDEVRRYLEEGDDTPTILARAYGAFDTYPDESDARIPSTLHRRGIDPIHVPAAMQGNTSEVQLTLEVTHFMSDRPQVQTIVLVTGDRPYLPLVRWIREQGGRPLVAAVNPPQTADAPAFAEDNHYLDARNLLSQSSREDLLANAPQNGAAYTRPEETASPPPPDYQTLSNPIARRAVEITEEYFGQYDEVYLTPLLRKLSDILGPDHDPKSLVSELEASGAARLEKRNGYPYNYTVLIVNDDHPDVQEIHTEKSRRPSSPDESVTDVESESAPEESSEDVESPEDDVPSPTATVDETISEEDESTALDGAPDEERSS